MRSARRAEPSKASCSGSPAGTHRPISLFWFSSIVAFGWLFMMSVSISADSGGEDISA